MHPSPTFRLRFKLLTLILIVTSVCLVAAVVKQAAEIRSLTNANEFLRRSAEYDRTDHTLEVLRAAGAAVATRETVTIDEKWRGDPGLFARIADLRDLNFLGPAN